MTVDDEAIAPVHRRSAGGVRAERTARTRAAVLAAARDLFSTRGYRATSLRDIAAKADISHPGLLRHFSGKEQLLADVVAQYEADTEEFFLSSHEGSEPGTLIFAALAARNEEIPGYLALFATLVGEASSPRHPAHSRMKERYASLGATTADAIEEAQAHDVVDRSRDAECEALRITATWDGLQVLEQYLPARVAVVEALHRHEALLTHPLGWRDATDPAPSLHPHDPPAAPMLGDAAADAGGYRTGRDRRLRIVADAMHLFAAEGYADTSLRDIADRVGVSKSTLLHHYPSKDALLGAVVRARDAGVTSHLEQVPHTRAAEQLRSLPSGAAENATTGPGLIEVYAVLSCEAVPADHPAHEYFVDRFRKALDHFVDLFRTAQRDGDLPSHRDPEHEGQWLLALWDGLQYQWLYDRSVDIAAHLHAHLADVLPTRG